MNEALKQHLDHLHDIYNSESFIEDDPISIPHSYSAAADREIAGFLAATIAWGQRRTIVRNGHRIMELMDNAPHQFVTTFTESDLGPFDNFVHRTFNSEDLKYFLRRLQTLYKEQGGLGAYFQREYLESGDLCQVLAHFREYFFCGATPEQVGRSGKHLSSIERGSACKRLNMFLRWMVRSDSRGVDFGLWSDIPSSALYLPLDVHSGNVSRELGLLTRGQDDWRAVEQVTAALREFDPNDPVRYDFALFGSGVARGK